MSCSSTVWTLWLCPEAMTSSDCVKAGSMVSWWARLVGSPAEGRCSSFRDGWLLNPSLQSLLVTDCQDDEAEKPTQMICLLSLPDTFTIPFLYSKSFILFTVYWIKEKVWHERPAIIWCPNTPFTLYLQPLTFKNPPLCWAYLVLCVSQKAPVALPPVGWLGNHPQDAGKGGSTLLESWARTQGSIG